MTGKRFLTTGEVAEYCGVNFRTVIRWTDRGILKSYKLPGRGDNRIQVQDFIHFLQENSMPIPEEFASVTKRVLIVDDDLSVAKAIQRALRENGFETEIALDGFQAGSLLESFSPSTITLDLRMPGMSGLDVIKFIRKSSRFSAVRILVVSAMPRNELEEALEIGADDILAKPFQNEVLVERILTLIGKSD